MLMVFPVSGSNPRYIWSIVLSLKQTTGDHMYTDEAEAIIASQPPEAVATGELMVLKNTIKRKVSGPNKSRLLRLANSDLGSLCTRANSGNIEQIRTMFQTMVQLVRAGNLGQFETEIARAKTEF